MTFINIMYLNLFLKPKLFINNLSERFSWKLFLLFIVVTIGQFALWVVLIDIETIKEVMLTVANIPSEAYSQVANQTIIIALFWLMFLSLVYGAIKIGVLMLIIKLVFKIFKKNVRYFKLVNVYLYARIIRNIILLFGPFFVTASSKEVLINFIKGSINEVEVIKNLYTVDNIIYIIFSIIAFVLFYGLLIYGIKLSIRNNNVLIKK